MERLRLTRWMAVLGLLAVGVLSAAQGTPGPSSDAKAPPVLDRTGVRVYCAGPMGGPEDFATMRGIAAHLRKAGYQTYLPVDDGFSLILMYEAIAKSGRSESVQAEARHWLMVAVYTLDMYCMLERCNAMIANTNPWGGGAVNPEAGTVMEASFAAAYGIPLAFFKTDPKRLLPPDTVEGSGWDNPMIVGLSGQFGLDPDYAAGSSDELLRLLDSRCQAAGPSGLRADGTTRFGLVTPPGNMPKEVRGAMAVGRLVFELKRKYVGLPFTREVALRQADEVTALLRVEGPRHGFPKFKGE